MTKQLDWLIAGAITALGLMAEFQLVFLGVFEPLNLAAAIAMILMARTGVQQIPRLITKSPRRVPPKKSLR